MTTPWKYEQQQTLRQHAREAIALAESGNKPNSVSVVQEGTSGVAVGRYQMDLGAHKDLGKEIVAIVRRSGAFVDPKTGKDDKARIDHMERILTQEYGGKIRGSGNPTLTAEAAQATAWMTQAIRNPEVQAEINRRAEVFIDANIGRLPNLCGNAAPEARTFCNSVQGQVEIVAFMHQSGGRHNQSVKDFVEGRSARIGPRQVPPLAQGGGQLDVRRFRESIRDNTAFGRNARNRQGIIGRDSAIDGYHRDHGTNDATHWRLNPETHYDQGIASISPDRDASTQTAQADDKIKNRVLGIEPAPGRGYRPGWGTDEEYEAAKMREVEQAPPQAHVSVADEGAREQTTSIAASVAQPVAHRTTWNPDLDKINEAIAVLGADDLPPWTKTLLGRDVLANGSKAAVMGFQRAINAATKPLQFDYRWGLGGRQGRIDVDGDLGPQTRSGFGRAVEKQGEDGFSKLYALDQFGRYVKSVDLGRAKLDDLEDTVGGTLGQAVPDAPERAQETLNMFAEDRAEPGAPLKIDGWIGPKTTEAFGTLLRKTGPERLLERFSGKDFWADGDLT